MRGWHTRSCAALIGADDADVARAVRTGQHAGGGATGATAAAQHRRHHGRRHRHLEHRRLSPRHDGGTNAQPRQDRRRGDAVYRLLRRGELHGRPGELHHRTVADPHRHDHGRPGRRGHRPAGGGADHRHRTSVDGLRHRPIRRPPWRQERVPADGARLRTILRLPLPSRCDGRPLSSELSAGPPECRWSAQYASYETATNVDDADGRSALGQGRKAEDRGRGRTVSEAYGNRG